MKPIKSTVFIFTHKELTYMYLANKSESISKHIFALRLDSYGARKIFYPSLEKMAELLQGDSFGEQTSSGKHLEHFSEKREIDAGH